MPNFDFNDKNDAPQYRDFEYDFAELKNAKSKIDLSDDKIILLIGEGDMSFTSAFAYKKSKPNGLHRQICQMNIIATEFKPKALLQAQYANLESNLDGIALANQKSKEQGQDTRFIVIYGVDVRDLSEHCKLLNVSRDNLFRIHCNFPWYYRDKENFPDQKFKTSHMVTCVFEFADKMLGPHGQLNLALCECERYYPEYGLEEALQKFGARLKFVEKVKMSDKYKEYRHVSSKGSDTIIPWTEETGYEHVYVKTGTFIQT
jgi:hypothetical protein